MAVSINLDVSTFISCIVIGASGVKDPVPELIPNLKKIQKTPKNLHHRYFFRHSANENKSKSDLRIKLFVLLTQRPRQRRRVKVLRCCLTHRIDGIVEIRSRTDVAYSRETAVSFVETLSCCTRSA